MGFRPGEGEGQGRTLGPAACLLHPTPPRGQRSQALSGPALSEGITVSELKESLESTHSADEDTERDPEMAWVLS